MVAIPLTEALAAGTARFGTSPVREVHGSGLGRARRHLASHLAAFPVTTGDYGVRHLSGLVYARLAMSGSAYLVASGRSNPPPIEPGQPVTVVTGTCLFGRGSLTGWAGGQPVTLLNLPRQLADAPAMVTAVSGAGQLHIYERETSRVLGGFLRDLSALPGMGELTVHIHIPHAEYWLWGVEMVRCKLMSASAFSEYALAMEHRTRLVVAEFLGHLGGKVTVRTESPLDWARWEWDSPWATAAQHGQLWGELAARRDSDALEELCNLSYVHAYLAAERRARLQGDSLLFVETPDELPVWRRARELSGELGVSLERAAAWYIHPELVASGDGPAYLYNLPAG